MLRGDKAGQAGIQMGRADMEWKVKWGSEVGGQHNTWELKSTKANKEKERKMKKKITEEEKK